MEMGTAPMERESVFVDTWGWLALGQHREPHHDEVKRIYRELSTERVPVYTTDYVMDELITLLFRREPFGHAVRYVHGVLAAAAGGHLRIERVTADRFTAAWALRKRFQDKPTISFTDLVSMAVMREQHILRVLTQDRHFEQAGMGFRLLP